MSQRHLRDLERRIRPFGLSIVRGRGHPRILDADGRFLTPVSNSPTDPHACALATLRRLVRLGAVPAETLRRG
jgi:hypothetical protein